ncbi:MAG: hypothetical protein AB7F31_00045 [Parachlamydiales bacterium]
MGADIEFKDYFHAFNKAVQTSDRFCRLFQGGAGILIAAGFGNWSFTVLDRTITLANVASAALAVRMTGYATEIFQDVVRIKIGDSFADLLPEEQNKERAYGTLKNATDLGFLTVDLGCFFIFATQYLKVMQPNRLTQVLDQVLTPALTLGFTGILMQKHSERERLYKEIADKKALDSTYQVPADLQEKVDTLTRAVRRFSLDLAFTLIPILMDKFIFEGSTWKSIGQVCTGGYVLWVFSQSETDLWRKVKAKIS